MNFPSAPIQEIKDELLAKQQVRLFVKREDLIHPTIKGNKWYKLKYNLEEAKKQGLNKLLTFGGAFSNHIYATASAGNLFGFQTIGIIRGEAHLPLNPILSHARDYGMELHYLDRTAYRQKTEERFINQLKKEFGDFYLIPEGGTNALAVKGTAEILENIDFSYQYVCCACGTGGTMAGLVRFASEKNDSIAEKNIEVLGFSVLKGVFLEKEVKKLLIEVYKNQTLPTVEDFNGDDYNTKWSIAHDYHFGGYAKTTSELLDFVSSFNQKYQIPIEPIYTGKLFYGIFDKVQKGYFARNSVILAIHSGGVYGEG